jgi:hypothetical protein
VIQGLETGNGNTHLVKTAGTLYTLSSLPPLPSL